MSAPAPYTETPNWAIDLAPLLSGAEFKALIDAVRQTCGWHRATYDSTTAEIAERIGVDRTRTGQALARLAALGLVPCEVGRRNAYVRRLGPPVTPDELARRIDLLQNATAQTARPVAKSSTDLLQNATGGVAKCNRSDRDTGHQDAVGEMPKERSKEKRKTPPPTPASDDTRAAPPLVAAGGGGASLRSTRPGRNHAAPPPSPGALYLNREGFSDWAVQTFGHLPLDVLQADVERRRSKGQGEGAIVKAWKLAPPVAQETAAPRPSARPLYEADIDHETRGRLIAKWGRAQTPDEQRAVLAELRRLAPMGRTG
jgi:hypothetical protein